MKATARIACLLIAAALVMALLAGCKPPADVDDGEWVYDFTTDGDAIPGSDWYVDAGWMGEYPSGYWLNQASIAAPYLFTGDFTAEFVFYLKFTTTEEDDYIYRFAFRLVDPLWDTANRNYVSLTALYTKFPQHEWAEYEVAQGNGSYLADDTDGNIPGLTSGLNTCTMVRTGTTVTIRMNGALVGTVTVDPANEPVTGYAPLIHGHNSWDQAESNFYIRKLTVTYTPGEMLEYDWN